MSVSSEYVSVDMILRMQHMTCILQLNIVIYGSEDNQGFRSQVQGQAGVDVLQIDLFV